MTDLTQQDNTGDEFTDDLGGAYPYEPTPPVKKDFKPWHKPRKQYVRERQWTDLINDLVTQYNPIGNTIKYLSLPGDDLLDLRYLHDNVCVPKELKIKYLGFNKGQNPGPDHDASLEVSRNEINNLPFVDEQSKLLPDDIVRISGSTSVAYTESRDMAPFDIINIDLCDSIAKEDVEEFEENHYNTINTLMALQAYRKDPWLLLITTRTNERKVNPKVFEILKKIYLDNLNSCQGFRQKSSSTISVDGKDALDGYCTNSAGFSNVFLIGLSKWIQGLCVSQVPQKEVEIKSIMGYKVWPKASAPDMISIALQIIPTATLVSDRSGLSTQKPSYVDECAKAISMLDQLSSQIDVDNLLLADEELRKSMANDTTQLLKQARYDVDGYDAWLAKFPNTTKVHSSSRKPEDKQAVDQQQLQNKKTEVYSNKYKLPGPKQVGQIDPKTLENILKGKKR